jgi:FMN phosphatase YigB (HAD superfamily)
MRSASILFCDFNGVLSYKKYWDTLSNPRHKYNKYHSTIINYLFVENRKIFNEWMIGKYTLEEIHKLISQKTGIPYRFILNIFEDECRRLDVSKIILNKITALKDNYYRILATGNMDSFNRFTLPANPLLYEAFDEINNSYDLGILKTTDNGRYFVEVCKRLEIPIENCVLIDDSPDICKIFTNLGGTAYCVTGVDNVCKVVENLDYPSNIVKSFSINS